MIRIITFLLGFYVSSLLKRYWTKVSRVPDAEDALVALGGLTTEKAEEVTKVTSPGGVNEAKKMVARYCLLAWTMCFNTFSQPLAENFGRVDQLVEKGLLTEEEQAQLLEVLLLLPLPPTPPPPPSNPPPHSPPPSPHQGAHEGGRRGAEGGAAGLGHVVGASGLGHQPRQQDGQREGAGGAEGAQGLPRHGLPPRQVGLTCRIQSADQVQASS